MYETCASEDMDPPVLGSRILTRLIILYVMGFNRTQNCGVLCEAAQCIGL